MKKMVNKIWNQYVAWLKVLSDTKFKASLTKLESSCN